MRVTSGLLVLIGLIGAPLQAQATSGIRVGATNVARQDRVIALYEKGALIRVDVTPADAPPFSTGATFPLPQRHLAQRFREDDRIGSIMRSLAECGSGFVLMEGDVMRYVFRTEGLLLRYERACNVGRLYSDKPLPRVYPTVFLMELLERCLHGEFAADG
jgi:hypothetical protein